MCFQSRFLNGSFTLWRKTHVHSTSGDKYKSSVEPDQVPPLEFSVGRAIQAALLFTVVLSVRPSRIRRSHNPLFIPMVVQVVCKWTWVMADRERLASPAVRARREPWSRQRETHVNTFSSQANSETRVKPSSTNNTETERKEAKAEGFCLFTEILPALFLFSLCFNVMSPCKKTLWSFQTLWQRVP